MTESIPVAMHVAHSTGWYYPESSGGTEVYVATLLRELRLLGISGEVLAGSDGETIEKYEYEGVPVARFPVEASQPTSTIRGLQPHRDFHNFKNLIECNRVDVYHQHSWTQNCGIHHLRYAASIGIPVVLTIHLPSIICLRGTLMLHGRTACDGRIERQRCTHCWGLKRNMPRYLARSTAAVPARVSRWAMHSGALGRLGTALASRALVDRQRELLQEACSRAARVIVLSQWLYDALLKNDVAPNKMTICRHGVGRVFDHPKHDNKTLHHRIGLTVGYLGRIDPVKGLEVLIQAFRQIPESIPVTMQVYTIEQGPADSGNMARLRNLAGSDRRISFNQQTDHDQIPAVLDEFDVLAVPSLYLETGPLVVLEALAVGIPVLGSDLGGIREHVIHQHNGYLLPPGNTAAWRDKIVEIARRPDKLDALRPDDRPTRTMRDVAMDMRSVYRQVVRATA